MCSSHLWGIRAGPAARSAASHRQPMGNQSLRWFEVIYSIPFHTQDVWIWPTSQFQPMALESAGNVLVLVDFKLSKFMVGIARSPVL